MFTSCHFFATVGPTSVSLTRSVPSDEVELGTEITYTCTSSGGIPAPSLRLLADSSEVASGPEPTLTHVLTPGVELHNKPIKCEAFNDYGTVSDSETLTLFSKTVPLVYKYDLTRLP